jgi:hypothetical protein
MTKLTDRCKMDFALPQIHRTNGTKFILFWSRFFNMPTWGVNMETYGEDYLRLINCSFTNCLITHNRNLLNSTALYDAVIIHGSEQFAQELIDIPSVRSPHQFYIQAIHE